MKCPKCGSERLRVFIDVQMYIDFEDYHNLTKKAIAKKTTEIYSMDDSKSSFLCKDCQWHYKSIFQQKVEQERERKREKLKKNEGLTLVTSNKQKLVEFRRFGLKELNIEKGRDLREVDSNELFVTIYKALDAGSGRIVEDTSLRINGAEIGTNVRWLLDNIHQHAGSKATWIVSIGVNNGETIQVFGAEISGHIVTDNPSLEGFGFDCLFIPEGTNKTLYELELDGLKDDFSARKNAVIKMLNDKPDYTMKIEKIPEWKGRYQK